MIKFFLGTKIRDKANIQAYTPQPNIQLGKA